MRPEAGTKIRILETRGARDLSPGDVVVVDHDPKPPKWIITDAPVQAFDWIITSTGCGWITFEILEGPVEGPVPDPLRARLSRQRHELRRLNQQCRLMRLERDQSAAHLDLAMKALLQTREELAVCRLMKSSTS